MSKQAMEIIEQVANNLGEFAEAMETQHKANVLSQYTSELFNCAALLKEAIKQHDAEPVAWMWQHDETGTIGFVEHDQDLVSGGI